MRAGALRQRVTIQRRYYTQGADGEEVPTWSTVDTVWALVEPVRGREYVRDDLVRAEATHLVRMRYRTGIDASARLLWGTSILDIHDVADVGARKRELLITCKEAK
jgi:SPP1 family predicted phage head-tail adaptor